MPATITWTGSLTATSSIAHGGQTRGTITLLRRELIIQPDGRLVHVPVISGNGFRGRLRRIGEELLREVLGYEGQLPLTVAHALRGGGALAKTSSAPLSGTRLHQLRSLVPHVGVFGCAGGGRIIDGCLQVGKVVPHLAETRHILPTPAAGQLAAFDATQVETYVRQDDASTHAFGDVLAAHQVPVDAAGEPLLDRLPADPDLDDASMLMMYRVETFPAGTRFATWLRLDRAGDLEAAFFTDVLAEFARHGRLGGRAAIGHGHVHVDLTRTVAAGNLTDVDWRAHLREHRTDALTALEALT
jgi:hypothetical protein